MILYESTLNVYDCIRWVKSMFEKCIWTSYSLYTIHLQRFEENWDKLRRTSLMQLQLKKKSFQEKKPQSCKIFPASHKPQISNGGIKMTLCCVSIVSSTSVFPAAARWEKKCDVLGHLEPLNCEKNYICLAIALTLHQAWDWKVLDTSWGFFFLFFSIPFQTQF